MFERYKNQKEEFLQFKKKSQMRGGANYICDYFIDDIALYNTSKLGFTADEHNYILTPNAGTIDDFIETELNDVPISRKCEEGAIDYSEDKPYNIRNTFTKNDNIYSFIHAPINLALKCDGPFEYGRIISNIDYNITNVNGTPFGMIKNDKKLNNVCGGFQCVNSIIVQDKKCVLKIRIMKDDVNVYDMLIAKYIKDLTKSYLRDHMINILYYGTMQSIHKSEIDTYPYMIVSEYITLNKSTENKIKIDFLISLCKWLIVLSKHNIVICDMKLDNFGYDYKECILIDYSIGEFYEIDDEKWNESRRTLLKFMKSRNITDHISYGQLLSPENNQIFRQFISTHAFGNEFNWVGFDKDPHGEYVFNKITLWYILIMLFSNNASVYDYESLKNAQFTINGLNKLNIFSLIPNIDKYDSITTKNKYSNVASYAQIISVLLGEEQIDTTVYQTVGGVSPVIFKYDPNDIQLFVKKVMEYGRSLKKNNTFYYAVGFEYANLNFEDMKDGAISYFEGYGMDSTYPFYILQYNGSIFHLIVVEFTSMLENIDLSKEPIKKIPHELRDIAANDPNFIGKTKLDDMNETVSYYIGSDWCKDMKVVANIVFVPLI